MGTNKNDIAVIYLAWLPYGIAHFKDFIKSYLRYGAGHDHKLVIAFNGQNMEHPDKAAAYIQYATVNAIANIEYLYFDSGQDIVIYKQAAATIDAGFFLFLNTYSQVENTNWLLHYVNNWKNNVGLIGASGSYANYLTAIRTKVKFHLRSKASVASKIRELKYLVKIFFLHRRNFKKFPAPHIRTNGFFTSREIFSSLKHAMIKNKMEAYFFENGKNSMTVQVQKMGYDCIIIDKNGRPYDVATWPGSGLFWNTNQDDLLITDNQTRMYDRIPEAEKKIFQEIAWNKNG